MYFGRERVPPKATSYVARISIVETPVDDKYIATTERKKELCSLWAGAAGGRGRKEKTS